MNPYQAPHAEVHRPDKVYFRLNSSRVVIYLAVGVLAILVSWSEHSSASPFHELLWASLTIRNALVLLLFPAELVGILVAGNIHSPSENAVYVAAFVQGSLMAALVNWLYVVWRSRRSANEGNAQ
jgi:hypothetical protein